MKIYILDRGWAGSGVVVANSREEAARIFVDEGYIPRNGQFWNKILNDPELKQTYLFSKEEDKPIVMKYVIDELEEHEIENFKHFNYGDE